MTTLYSIGHSNRSWEDFLGLLMHFHIRTLVDIRRVPGSRKFPHFDRKNMEQVLPGEGIAYQWMESLGGLRHPVKGVESLNTALTHPGFRAYADYMGTVEFRDSVTALIAMASKTTTAFMCAEALYWRCHRRLLSDYLTAKGSRVLHIVGLKEPLEHRPTDGVRLTSEGLVLYDKPE